MAAARHRHNGTADQQRQSIDHPTFNLSLDPASLDALAERVADLIADKLRDPQPERVWLDARKAAAYLDVPYSTFRKHTAAGRIRGKQDVRDGRLYFHPDDLDAWRRRPPE